MEYDLIVAYDRFAPWFQDLVPLYYAPYKGMNKGVWLAKFISEKFPKVNNILDCACGVGSYPIDIALYDDRNFKVDCSDNSLAMLRYAEYNADEAGIKDAMNFYHVGWEYLADAWEKKYDCILNIGINLYHLELPGILESLKNMQARLNPGGVLIIDNKNWMPDSQHPEFLTEPREMVRVFNEAALPPREPNKDESKSHYFFDIVWIEERIYHMLQVSLQEEEVKWVLADEKSGKAHVEIEGFPVVISNEDNRFLVFEDKTHPRQQKIKISYETIDLPGYPILSTDIQKLMIEAGFNDIQIKDKYKELYGEETGKYHFIIGENYS